MRDVTAESPIAPCYKDRLPYIRRS